MGLSQKILCPGPTKPPTKEQKERIELAWKILCEKGSVNPQNPLDTEDISLKEMLKKDPHALTRAHCDYNGDMDYDEFVKHVLAGNFDSGGE